MNDIPRDFVFTRYEARQGIAWLARAFAMFGKARLAWVVLLLIYYVAMMVLRSIPIVGPYLMSILKPVFAVGLLAAAWTQERGGAPHPALLLQGFRANLWSLLPIGIFFVGGITLAVFASSLVDGGKLLDLMSNGTTMSEAELAAALGSGALQGGMLFAAALSVPILLATWWAPALVVFQDAGPMAALGASLKAAFANWKPLLVYGLGVFFYGGVLPGIVTGLIALLMPASIGPILVVAVLLPYLLFFVATLHISDYVSYRDVFHAGETLAPLAGNRDVA